jgi:hypothetical protein
VRQPETARRTRSAAAEVSHADLRSLIESLIDAQLDGARLARRVMLLQELADAAESLATAAYDHALDAVADTDAVDRAVRTGSAASRANEDELHAAIAWQAHLEYTDDLVEAARDVVKAL